MSINDEKILQAILDPRWKVGKVMFDGSEHIFLSMQHPEHMTITWLIPREQAAKIGTALIDLASGELKRPKWAK